MNYYDEIKNIIINNEAFCKVRDYSKERNTVITYYKIGKLLQEAGGKYGDNIIDEYSEKLVLEVGKKYNRRTLFRMKQFYNVFSNEKVSPLVSQLNWTHCLILISIKDINKMYYYAMQVISNNLSKRQLEEIVKNKEYERLPIDTKNKIITNEKLIASDSIPNPILIKNNIQNDKFSEYVLKELILNNLDEFLLQLGYGFSYVGNEYKIKIGDRYNYIDLLLFNIEYNCYVVIELKKAELKKEHIGQIEVYMNYIDKNIKKINQDSTIGIIICKKNNEYTIGYCSDSRIIAREYELV